MSDNSESLKKKNCYTFAGCLDNNIEKDKVSPNNEIAKIIFEMVDITSEKAVKNDTNLTSDKTREEKSDVVEENDIPVRRSNRIRKSVVKKDEVTIPITKKTNKGQKKSDTSHSKNNQKNIELVNNVRKSSETLENESKNSLSSESSNEKVKVLSNKSLKSKNDGKQSKEKRPSPKSVQNEKKNTQSEKKKPARKNKKSEKTQNSVDDCITDNISSQSLDAEKSESAAHSTALPSTKVLDSVSNPEGNRSENSGVAAGSSEDNCSDPAEKLPEGFNNMKPVKVKSRWWRSSELEAVMNTETVKSDPGDDSPSEDPPPLVSDSAQTAEEEAAEKCIAAVTKESAQSLEAPAYDHIEENIYRFNRKKCKGKKQVRRMVCDCTLTKEEQEYGVLGCKEECLNRLLMIECGSRCPLGESCSNKKFQKKEYAKAEIFKTEKKGWGLRTLEDISAGDFLIEFVGEILSHKEYRQRVKQYAKEKNVHSYFMAMKPDEILDATVKGNLSRFINHSCDPNCETQKWTVNGELRVGVFAKRALCIGEELTLDYKFQRYGREAQKCYCGAEICSGFIGAAKQISIDAYSGKSVQIRKRKGSEEKKRDWEDMILEEEIEKLNGNRGLRNREDTLKLARLMVRADDASSRHRLLDIILKTKEQACLRLFLDYHGLPLLWSWMTDVSEFELKAKILQVLSLLPISNKTMLLDSKVMSIVEKWLSESSSILPSEGEMDPEKSSPAAIGDEGSDSLIKKMKLTDFSDSETDSTSSHTVADSNNEMNSASTDTKISSSTEGILQSECSQESTCDQKEPGEVDPNGDLKQNIVSLASGLISNWKNLKEVFRIPRLEQQKRKEDEMEVDNNAKEKVENESAEEIDVKCGDQIQVVISGKNVFSDHRRAYDFESDVKLEDCPRRFSQPRAPSVLAKPRQVSKPVRHQVYPKQLDAEMPLHSPKEGIIDLPKIPGDLLPPGPQTMSCPPPLAPFSNQPPITYPPLTNAPVPSHPPSDNPSQLIYPPHIMYPPSQLPFVGSSAPVLPHNPAVMPPPASVTTQPPLIQQPPINAGLPPCQSLPPPNQPNVVGPPNPNNFLLPPNVPPTSVVPGTSQFVPSQPAPVRPFPPTGNVYPNQNPPLYFIPPQTSNPPPAVSFPENVQIQPSITTFPAQTVIPVKEEPKPIKLPKNWRTATDSEGNVYYYHSVTRQTQWDPPSEEDDSEDEEEDSNSEESESSDTPTYDEPKLILSKHSKKRPRKRKPTKAAADTSVVPIRPEVAKKIKELFRTKMSTFIVYCLNAYRKSDCTVGRITSNEDFKYLARKLTHYTMTKELKQCKNVEDLDCNETVMHKAKDFIKKYMAKYGAQYTRKEKSSPP